MNLKTWMMSTNTTQAELAKNLNCTQGRVSQVAKKGTDSLSFALAVFDVTGGEVGLNDLMYASDEGLK